jgi:hypothetical protein
VDLGLFARRRVEFWAWVFGPAALIVALQCFLEVYARQTASRLEERKALVQVVPQMQARQNAARDLLRRFAGQPAAKKEPVEDLRRKLNQSAQQSGFVINQLSVEKGEGKSGGNSAAPVQGQTTKAQTLTVKLSGEGTLTTLIRFLDALERPENLTVMALSSIREMRGGEEPVYQADFSFRCHVLTI